MSDIITTLHKKGDNTVNVYPNIKNENIPSTSITQDKLANSSVGTTQLEASSVTTAKIASNAVTNGKLANGAVGNTKIEDGAVTTAKLANGAVSNAKLASNAVTSSNIVDGSVTFSKIANNSITPDKLSATMKNIYDRLLTTYLVYAGNSFDVNYVLIGTTTIKTLNLYTSAELDNALDFDKATSSDFTNTDLDILALLVDGFIYNKRTYGMLKPYYITIEDHFNIALNTNNGDNYEITMALTGSIVYRLNFTLSTHTITTYTYDGSNYPYISISQLIQA